MFFIHLIDNDHVKHPRFHVSVNIFFKKHLILIENGVSNNAEWMYGQNTQPCELGPFIFFVAYEWVQKAGVFVPGKPL